MSGRRVVAGLDEAGLGPLLGPLTIGFTAFAVPMEGEGDPWKLLRRVVAKDPARCGKRLVVADSKRVFTRNPKGRRRLEETALSFLALREPGGAPPRDARALLFGALRPLRRLVEEHPWYAELPGLPVEWEVGSLELRAARLAREMERQGVALLDAGVRVVPAGELNASYRETGNKAATVWAKTREVIRHLWRTLGEEGPEVTVDLLGGRTDYGPVLARGFPEAGVRLLFARDHHCGYELVERRGKRRMRIVFRKEGETHSFPVALGSCLAKYARETVMAGFNAHFHRVAPGVKPTAGYRTDAQRWLREVGRGVEGVARGVLVRER